MHACSLFQRITVCYESGQGISDQRCDAWPETYAGPFVRFEEFIGDACQVTLGGIGWNTVKFTTRGTLLVGVDFPDPLPDIQDQATVTIEQQVADDGGYWAWPDVAG